VLLFCDSLSLRLVLRVFSTVLPNTYESRDWVMCCSLWFLYSLCLVLEYFQQSYPISTAGIEWCAALCDSFRLVLEYFQQSYPISTYESRDWVMCCSFVIPFFVVLRVFSTVLPNSYLWKQGLVCCSLWFLFFVWS
jgi:hypothetical protein